MKYDQFLAEVRHRGEYSDSDEAARVSQAVLEVLASRVTPTEANDLAAQLSGPLGEVVSRSGGSQAATFGVDEFCQRVADRTGTEPRTAERDASTVLSTVADSVSGGELNDLISQLPSGYAVLFGRADLSG